MFDTSRYTVAWICTIPTELTAACVHLDTEHDSVDFEATENDDNIYVFGSIGKHNVVVAALPSGETGTVSAATAASDLIRTFTNVRVGLMVGVGGGAPLYEKQKRDIRLGDVVVSNPGNGQGGVCQYDYGKAIQEKEFVLTGHLNSPPALIRTAVTMLRSDFELNGNGIDTDVAEILNKRPSLRKTYQRPDTGTDHLHQSSFVHPDMDKSCSVTCQKEDQVVKRGPRDPQEDLVTIHYGLIASANKVINDAPLRDKIAKEMHVLCFDTQAAGLMNVFPFLVVRGIYHYSDSHAGNGWQGYAAMTAAAYARKLLLRLPGRKVESEREFAAFKDFKEILLSVEAAVTRIQFHLKKQAIIGLNTAIERWLAAPDPSTDHLDALQLCHRGSGSWVLSSAAFQGWQQGRFPVIWLYGTSGCGKTVLTSTIIEHLCGINNSNEAVLYFYLTVADAGKRRLHHVLRSLIIQLCHLQQEKFRQLDQVYEGCKKSFQPSTQQLINCFSAMCSNGPVTIILDALDESESPNGLLEWIKTIHKRKGIRILITSRPHNEIRTAVFSFMPIESSLEIKGDSLDKDIKAFVNHSIYQTHDELKRWRSKPEIQKEIEEHLIEKADGMFVATNSTPLTLTMKGSAG